MNESNFSRNENYFQINWKWKSHVSINIFFKESSLSNRNREFS